MKNMDELIGNKPPAKSHAGTMTPDLPNSSEPLREVTALKVEKRPKRKPAAIVRMPGKRGAKKSRRGAERTSRHEPLASVISLKKKPREGKTISQKFLERIILLRRQMREIQQTLKFEEALLVQLLETPGAEIEEGVHTARVVKALEIDG